MRKFSLLLAAVLVTVAAGAKNFAFGLGTPVQTDSGVEITGMSIDNVGMGGRLIRLTESSIFLDDSGLHLEGAVNIKASGFQGKRIICMLEPLDANGERQADRQGDALSLWAVNVPNAQYAGKIKVSVPYGWLDLENKRQYLSFAVTLFDSELQELTRKTVQVDAQSIKIDGNKAGHKIAGDLLGGSEGLMGGILDGLLGGSTAKAESLCRSCDGTGICPECEGDGFFSPSVCRRCAKDPGICRRCKGEKKESVEYDINIRTY